MTPKKLTKNDILLAADAAAAWPYIDFGEWTIARSLGHLLTADDGRIGYG